MKTLHVALGDRSYPIHIGSCFENASLWEETLPHQEIVIVTNETIAPLYLEKVSTLVSGPGKRVSSVVLPDGEQFKTLGTVERIYQPLLEQRISRKAVLVALGGGVIGDMTGFAAATYQRGIDFVQVPTTLLSQVDSSVGGKTGVNHPLGKNMIGAFKQPIAVFIDPSTLNTLPDRELAAGFAEVIKHAAICDTQYLDILEQNSEAIFQRDGQVLTEVIERSCAIKADVVAKDEHEQGLRATLNFGHTFGHAIETTMGYGAWLHGEAVAAGMVMAAQFSERLGWMTKSDVDRLTGLIKRSHLPISPPKEMTSSQFIEAMSRDKKVEAGTLKLILLKSLGHAEVTSDFDPRLLQSYLTECCAEEA